MIPGDRFRVKPGGGYDDHLWGKEGVLLATYIGGRTGQTVVKAKMDTLSSHREVPITVGTFFDYLTSFKEAVEAI